MHTPSPSPVNAAWIDAAVVMTRVLADRNRVRLVAALCDGERNVSNLSAALHLPQPTVSHHLAILRMSGVVATRKAGKENYYRLSDGHLPDPSRVTVRFGEAGTPGAIVITRLQTNAVRAGDDQDAAEIKWGDRDHK